MSERARESETHTNTHTHHEREKKNKLKIDKLFTQLESSKKNIGMRNRRLP